MYSEELHDEIDIFIENIAKTLEKLGYLDREEDEYSQNVNILLENIKHFTKRKAGQVCHLNQIGAALSTETKVDNLLEMIISKGKLFTNADGGTLYMMGEDEKSLAFRIVETDSLGIKMGANGEEISWPTLPLYLEDGSDNNSMVAVYCALNSKIINFEDVYNADGFDFEGTKNFDAGTGFRSKSMLVVPMINNNRDVIGVLQLINARDHNDEIVSFTHADEEILHSLTSQAAVAITNVKMISDLKNLLESFIRSIAFAVDQKSPYTGGHVNKVAIISLLLAEAINKTNKGKYADIHYSDQEIDEIRISALMHDVGKITTPQHVMDKGTKLETIYDRIHTVKIRVELLKSNMKIKLLEDKLEIMQNGTDFTRIKELEENLEKEFQEIDEELKFLSICNVGGEFMRDEDIAKIEKIAKRKIMIDGTVENLLSGEEVLNLSIRKGTLTSAELEVMRMHAMISTEMLEALPFPKHLKRVPEIAGGHHEKLNGKGYPRGLTADQLTLESRILALADIFEALSAADRPYKDAKKMSEIMKIINFMVKDTELDGDLVDFFYENKLHLKFAKENFKPEQIDIS